MSCGSVECVARDRSLPINSEIGDSNLGLTVRAFQSGAPIAYVPISRWLRQIGGPSFPSGADIRA